MPRKVKEDMDSEVEKYSIRPSRQTGRENHKLSRLSLCSGILNAGISLTLLVFMQALCLILHLHGET